MQSTDVLLINIPQAAEVLGVSVRHLRRLIASGEVPHLRLGHRVLVPVAALEERLAALLDEATRAEEA